MRALPKPLCEPCTVITDASSGSGLDTVRADGGQPLGVPSSSRATPRRGVNDLMTFVRNPEVLTRAKAFCRSRLGRGSMQARSAIHLAGAA